MSQRWELKSTIKYPTALIINGVNPLGLDLAKSLIEQGGYVVLVDAYTTESTQKILDRIEDTLLLSFLDYSSISHLDEDLRRLDYVFYLNHKATDLTSEVSTQEFLKQSNYLDTVLGVAAKFSSKFLLTTSVKANQLQLANMDMEVNFGSKASKKHMVYTQMEQQRYSEGLVLEYANKANLDTRIIRLGEIIGQDIDLSINNSVNQLIQQAVTGNDLKLKSDGLQDFWYVNSEDAVYALIKAQFNRDTLGEVFTAAYEQPITDLSLAYKLQEIEPLAREISFVEDENNYLPLRLYKPATLLQTIGWKPKYNLDESLKDSVAQAKLDLITRPENAKDLTSKIRSLLNVANVVNESEAEAGGPIARLIQERKKQEQARSLSMEVANTKVKNKFSARQLTPVQRLQKWFWKNIFDPATNFGPLRKLTLAQTFGLLIFILVGGLIYFQIISPAAIVLRNIVVIQLESSNLKLAAAQNPVNYNSVYQSSLSMANAVKEIKLKVNELQFITNQVGAGTVFKELDSRLQAATDLATGVSNLAYSQIPIGTYLANYSDNIRFRANKDNYLAATQAIDYSAALDEIFLRSAYSELGNTQVQNAQLQQSALNTSLLPSILLNEFNKVDEALKVIGNTQAIYNTAAYLPELLGQNKPKNYAILITDNSRPTPLGGDVMALLQVSIQNGGINEIKVQPTETTELDFTTLPRFYSDLANLNSFDDVRISSIADLGLLPDVKNVYLALSTIWGSQLSRELDGVMVINLEALAKILNITGPLDLEGQQTSAAELLANLESLQTPTPTINRRSDLIAQVAAKTIDSLWDNLNQNFTALTAQIVDSVYNKDITLHLPELGINKVLAKQGITNSIANADFVVQPILTRSIDIISPTRFPAFTQSLDSNISETKSYVGTINLSFPSVNNLTSAGLCVSKIATNFKVIGIPTARQKLKENADLKCIIVKLTNETELTFGWDSLPFESSDVKEYNFAVAFIKQSGNQVTSDLELQVPNGFTIAKVEPTQKIDQGKIAFSLNLLLDQLIKLSIIKN